MLRLCLFFVAGFLAVIFFHQPILGLLHGAGIVPSAPFNLSPTAPLGVPSIISGAFWGGVWGIVMLSLLRWQADQPQPWLKGLFFGGIALTAVALFVVFPLKGIGFNLSQLPPRFFIGFLVNSAWGVGTLIFARTLLSK